MKLLNFGATASPVKIWLALSHRNSLTAFGPEMMRFDHTWGKELIEPYVCRSVIDMVLLCSCSQWQILLLL
jgi:hypothetical protein